MKLFDLFYKIGKPHRNFFLLWLFLFTSALLTIFTTCKKDENAIVPVFFLKTGSLYAADGASVPLGGQIRIGIIASGADCPLTYLRIDKISNGHTVVELDNGIYIGKEGMNQDFTFSKDTAATEVWVITLMNSDRQQATQKITVQRGAGSAFGDIWFFPSVTIGHQSNTDYPHYLDVDQGIAYNASTLPGHESEIDVVCYFYVTSGLNSPSLSCPGYTAAVAYYPAINSWPVKNSILYDYFSSDNNLVSASQFNAAMNDSILVNSFKPEHVSGNCKYCYTGKIIPFKTQQSKYGLIKVIRADESAAGSMEIAIKIQQ